MYVSRQQKNKIGHRLSLLITQTKFLPEIAPKRWAAADGMRIQLHIQELHNVEVYNVYSELGGGGGSFFGGGSRTVETWKLIKNYLSTSQKSRVSQECAGRNILHLD